MKHEFLSSYHPVFWMGLMGVITFVFLYTTPIRSALYLEFLFLPITLSIVGFTSKYDKKIWEKAIIYFMIGLSWELLTETNWTYTNNFLPMLYFYRDIPIAMLLYWVSIFSLAFFSFYYLTKKLRINALLAQIITIFGVLLVAESIGFNVLRMWNYNFDSLYFVPLYFLPVHMIIGYLVFGNLFLIFMKKELYKPRYLINFILETAENPSKTTRHLLESD